MSDSDKQLAHSFFREKNTNFPSKPKVIEDLDIFEMPDGLGMQFRGLSNPVVMKGLLVDSLLPLLLPLLDGTRDLSAITKSLPVNTDFDDVAALLMNLFIRGIIVDEETNDSKVDNFATLANQRQRLFWSRRLGVTRLNRTSLEVDTKIKTAKILLIAEGLLGAKVFDLLAICGFQNIELITVNNDPELDRLYAEIGVSPQNFSDQIEVLKAAVLKKIDGQHFVIAAVRNCSNDLVETINELCINHSIEWLRVQDNGSGIECGPYVNPHHSPCFACMLTRQISVNDNAVEEELYQQKLSVGQNVSVLKGESISLICTAASYAIQDVERILTGLETPFLGGRVVKFSSDGNIESSNFLRVPGCEICSRASTLVRFGGENGISAN
ncbi:MAG: TOMM precursor leader peptide-binding protein [Leptolyngbya sp.]|nr:TOMM precursor leader peptide-binding protein [Candidatus Melainabacteria bacterium]